MDNPILFYRGLAIAVLVEVFGCGLLAALGWLALKLLGSFGK